MAKVFEDDEDAPPCLFCGQPVEEEPNECNSLYHALAFARGPITQDMYERVFRETVQYYADHPGVYEPGAVELIAANPAAVDLLWAEQMVASGENWPE